MNTLLKFLKETGAVLEYAGTSDGEDVFVFHTHVNEQRIDCAALIHLDDAEFVTKNILEGMMYRIKHELDKVDNDTRTSN